MTAGLPMLTKDTTWEEQVLQAIVGKQLSSVEFVQDYVQLRFDGPTLTAVTPPTIEIGDGAFLWNEPGFRDEICKRITRKVVAARIVPGDSVQIELDDATIVKVSLKTEDYRAAEAANFRTMSEWWVL